MKHYTLIIIITLIIPYARPPKTKFINRRTVDQRPKPLYELAQDVFYVTKQPLPVPIYSAPHTHRLHQGESIKSIDIIIFLT
jgi:hypothetical protein